MILVDPKLFPSSYSTLEVARDVFSILLVATDVSCLTNEDGTDSYLGKCLIAKALSLIQLECTYIMMHWCNDLTGDYTKDEDDFHCRSPKILDYLHTIDKQTAQNIKIPLGPSTVDLGVLFPIPPYAKFETRSTNKKQKVVLAAENSIFLEDNRTPWIDRAIVITDTGFQFVSTTE